MQIFPFHAHIPDLKKVKFDDLFYQGIREDFYKAFRKGVFKPVPGEAFFILEIKEGQTTSTGLIAMTDIRDYLNQHIRKHERTLDKKQKLHHQLFIERRAMIKPAALMIPAHARLNDLYREVKSGSKPLLKIRFPDKTVIHTLWKVDDPRRISSLSRQYKQSVRTAVIADGHHRFATSALLYSRAGGWAHQRILTVYFTPDQLKISGFFRVVDPLKSSSAQKIAQRLKQATEQWEPVQELLNKKDFLYMAHDHQLYRFRIRARAGRVALPLLFSEKILNEVFEIRDETRSPRISYFEKTYDVEVLKTLMEQYPQKYIFILPSLTPREILSNKKILPPKSTYFMPRIINGLVVALGQGL
ncbi:MAG TPA: DUF1015 family protein [Saprospiraceae bacterium]|nr:DUF1015 family protein [Saprospiraceae bacterium]HNT20385.1 DUF1015 family protein [Saprospiraceae bacterium]